jgi:hypothetical protein
MNKYSACHIGTVTYQLICESFFDKNTHNYRIVMRSYIFSAYFISASLLKDVFCICSLFNGQSQAPLRLRLLLES